MKKAAIVILLASIMIGMTACGTPQPQHTEESSQQSAPVSSEPELSSEPSADESESESSAESVPESKADSKPESSLESRADSKPEDSQEAPASSAEESSKPVEEASAAQVSQISRTEASVPPVSTEISSVSLNKSSVTLYPGQSFRLVVTVTPDTAADRSAQLSWSDDSVISVDPDGTITAKAVGTSVVTAKTKNGKTADCTVIVKERPPQPEPQPSQVPQPSQPTPQPQTSQQSEPWTGYVGAVWFNDAVFVGDSVTLKLSYYSENGSLGNAAFLCAGSLGYNNALWELNRSGNVHPTLYGKKYTVDEGVRASGKKKVFIMLGMNDVGLYGVDGAAEGMKTLTDRILAKSPDVKIYIQSVTPMLKNMQRSALNNRTIPQFNEKLRQICSERGFVYLDVASAVRDSEGNLSPENCSDPGAMGIHFTDTGCSKWVDYLKRHVG